MPTKSEKTTAPAVDYSTMNAYQKLQIARSKFLQAGVKKTAKTFTWSSCTSSCRTLCRSPWLSSPKSAC